jgi:hypothetical protein
VQSHFRAAHLDPADPDVERALRSYAYSGLIACFALDRLLTESDPDVMLLFNGRQSSTRVALELARARGVRVVVHERGPRSETLLMVENATCQSLEPLRRFWREWGDVPLSRAELDQITRHMAGREQGHDTGWLPYTGAPQRHQEVLERLRLRPDRPIWALFTSSDDEAAGNTEFSSPFASQHEWIVRTIDYARRHHEIDLVVRVHPNTGGRRSSGANRTQLEQMRSLAQRLPPNVRMIDPDDEISSYPLMDLCSVGMVWISTVGLELACKGKNVVIAAGNYIAGTSFAHTVTDAARYDELLDTQLELAPRASSAEIARLAMRFAYGMYFRLRIPFPLVRMTTPRDGELAYDSLDALLPGRDAGADRCARIVLDGEPVCPPPGPQERARETAAEDALLPAVAKPRVTVLAFADELIADIGLLEAWAEAFDGREDVTLLIHTRASETPQLVEAVTRAGLDREDGPDLVAGEIDAGTIATVAAVLSRVGRDGAPAAAPRYDAQSLRELAESI